MKLGTLLFAAFVLIVGLCFSSPVAESSRRIRMAYLESAVVVYASGVLPGCLAGPEA